MPRVSCTCSHPNLFAFLLMRVHGWTTRLFPSLFPLCFAARASSALTVAAAAAVRALSHCLSTVSGLPQLVAFETSLYSFFCGPIIYYAPFGPGNSQVAASGHHVLPAIMCGGVYFLGRHCAGRCVCCGNDNGVRITDMCHLDWNLVDGGVNVSC